MAWFEKDFIEFFKELAANNHKEWFDENRKRYQKVVKAPFQAFVSHLIEQMHKVDKDIEVEPKDCIFRINRDIRFAKDKTPYKINVSAAITKGGKKNYAYPGLYFELGPEVVKIYGGVYKLDKEDIQSMREYMAKHSKQLNSLLEDKDFTGAYGGELHGEKNKVLPKELKEAAETQPLIFNKNWYYFAKLPPKVILEDNLDQIIMDHVRAGEPMRKFLKQGLQ